MTYLSEFRMRIRKTSMVPTGRPDRLVTDFHVELVIDGDQKLSQRLIMSPEPDETEIDMCFRRAAHALKAALKDHREAG